MPSSNHQNRRADINQHLLPPDPAPDDKKTGRRHVALPILILFILLLFGSAAVLFLLPAPEPDQPSSSQQTRQQQVAPRAEPEVAALDRSEESEKAARDDAANAREAVLSLKVTADSQNIEVWGGDTYRAIHDEFAQADELFTQQDFLSATEQYGQIADDLQELLDSRPQRFKDAFEAGQRALLDEQPEDARNWFKLALAIDPSNKEALAGMVKSEHLASILSSLNKALALEEAGKLEEAVGELENALSLDKSYDPVLQARARIQAQIDEHTFQNDMNAVLSAIEKQDFPTAQKSLQTLQSLGINREQVEQAEQLLAEKQKLAFIKSNRGAAEGYKQKEQWKQALDTYNKILQTAPEALFAVAGKEGAAKRLKLDTALTEALEQPHRLQDKTQLTMATQLLAYAKQIAPQGPKLQSQISSLDTLLNKAATPVPVILESDNQTDIVIYHIGRIGSFFSKQINLRPGTYTVVGSKVGYRDVRKTLTIESDGSDYRLFIRCEEPI